MTSFQRGNETVALYLTAFHVLDMVHGTNYIPQPVVERIKIVNITSKWYSSVIFRCNSALRCPD